MQDVLERMTPIYEVANQQTISGRRPIKVVLHEIHPDASHYQHNGISWNEEYVKDNMESINGMSIVAEFLTEDRDAPYGHGLTDIKDNLPLFEDATMVGHFDSSYIDDIEIDGEMKRVLIAEGTLDEMRYPKFVEWLRKSMKESVVKGSVEIVGKPENDNHIIYSDGWKEKGRVPQFYDYSGYAILGIKPADDSAIIMELNSKQTSKEGEREQMDENMKSELTEIINSAVVESNSKWDEYIAKVQEKQAEIDQLRADIAEKDAEIERLHADFTTAEAARAAQEAGLAEANAKIDAMEKEKALNELNSALEPYTDEQREIAKAEIEAYQADPASIEINSIIGKICTEMVRKSREQKVNEINSQIDVFSIVEDSNGSDESEDDSVF